MASNNPFRSSMTPPAASAPTFPAPLELAPLPSALKDENKDILITINSRPSTSPSEPSEPNQPTQNDAMWPSHRQDLKESARKKRWRMWIKIAVAVVIVVGAVGLGLGITKAVRDGQDKGE